jgi:hypothetical protein
VQLFNYRGRQHHISDKGRLYDQEFLQTVQLNSYFLKYCTSPLRLNRTTVEGLAG